MMLAVDRTFAEAEPRDFEALEFVRHFFREGNPMVAICHAPRVLMDTGMVRAQTLTSWPAIKIDVRNAGGNKVDQEVVLDNVLVTSRKPDDIDASNEKMIEEFGEGRRTTTSGT